MHDLTLAAILTHDHRRCDECLATLEGSVQGGRWAEAQGAGDLFARALRAHLQAEEQVLFPAFERATGQRGGPTMMMRMEHDQMRGLLDALDAALRTKDAGTCMDLSDTLMVLIQQHNMKEEQVLYPMCDQVLAAGLDDLARQLQSALGVQG